MNQRKLITVAALALVAIACATGADMVGEMMDSGVSDADASTMPDGAGATAGGPTADVEARCNKSVVYVDDELYKRTRYWSEFDVDPGSTEVTACAVTTLFAPAGSQSTRETCGRSIAGWFRGTNTGYWYCGESIDWVDPDTKDTPFVPPISITVHR